MSVSLAILILYIAALFAISWYAKKRSEGEAENYALAGRKLNTPLIAVTIIGLAVGGASTIGVSEHAFRVGLSAGWYTIAWALGAIVMGMFMAKKYREQNITTISELIERHHDMKPLCWAYSARLSFSWLLFRCNTLRAAAFCTPLCRMYSTLKAA